MGQAIGTADYQTAVVQGASLLAIKLGTLNLLTVRSRLLTGDMGAGKPGGKSWKEESLMPVWTQMFFKFATCAFGPTPPTERFTGLVHNIVENEPIFLALAGAIGAFGKPGPTAATFVKTYVASRFFHSLVFLVEFPEVLA